ncbi:helix-turn-helix transcriptional regulator [Halomonas ramblicola]|uniref:helix-turn-helix transcriptional regulator n=1 Tax=Halomonas ramblicola TaxID=747349 RepID=UPI0025B566B2|nr:helix-turn-helix transcriptional regulator [Halomonas ramblicola]MDN3522214.1 helix-turn-helix transcriptional regulator [Halomonas ramblicola]
MNQPAIDGRAHTPRDLLAYGRRYGLDYRVPGLSPQAETPVVRGTVREFSLRPGMQLIASDVEVLHRYDSHSRRPTPLSIIAMLEGRAEVRLAGRVLTLAPGMALSVRLEAGHGLEASQPAGQRLRALTLSLDEAQLAALGAAAPASTRRSCLHAWRLPEPLRQGLDQALGTPPTDEARHRLLIEGLGLQLLAQGLPGDAPPMAPTTPLPPREHRRLERVRLALQDDPAREHRLDALAELAAMSPASLRRKFRAAFGRSVFDYLRECRLTLAHDYLRQGYSVQQAAHFSGYRHASNFTTAFRRHFGHAPSSLGRAS